MLCLFFIFTRLYGVFEIRAELERGVACFEERSSGAVTVVTSMTRDQHTQRSCDDVVLFSWVCPRGKQQYNEPWIGFLNSTYATVTANGKTGSGNHHHSLAKASVCSPLFLK